MKMRKMIVLIGIVTIILSTVLTGCGSKADPFAHISVEYDGYDTNGTAHIRFDEDSLIESIIGSAPDDFDKLGEWVAEYDELLSCLDISCTPSKNLSNGDTVTVSVAVCGDAAKKISGGEQSFTVSGLPEIQTIDFFKDIEITYNGIIGDYTSVQISKLTDDAALQACNFSIEPQSNIKNGDVVTVTISNADTLEKQYLCTPAETVKTFTVSGLDEYLTDTDFLPEDQIREIIDQYVIDSQKKDKDFWSYGEPVYYKTYFCIGDKNVIGVDINRLLIFVCYDSYVNGNYRQTNYVPLIFRDLILTNEGVVDITYESGSSPVFYTDPHKMMESLEEDYTVEEVYVEY